MTATRPRIRVVVLNYDGGDMTRRCLESLRTLDWPADALEVVLVDNASIDGLVPIVRRELPWVHVIEHTHNIGFAGGCNLGLRDLDGLDSVVLLNNDAIPDPGFLGPLVDALAADAGLGAACPKIVFAPRFVSLHIETATVRRSADGQELGVKITGLAADGDDVWKHAQFADGCYVVNARGTGDDRSCWTAARAEVRVPFAADAAPPAAVEIELSAEQPTEVCLDAGAGATTVVVGPEPTACTVAVGGEPYDVVNNVGSRLVEGGYGGDRGFLEVDRGQYAQRAEVFAWCGGAVLLSTKYLREVGLFDERYFMYYEDTDLAWRGRLAGWRYEYVPESVVRHEHAASSQEGSQLFTHFVERNRFLTLARNAPWPLLREALVVYVRDTLSVAKHEVLRPMSRGRRPNTGWVGRRLRALAAFVRHLPRTLRSRRRQHVSTAERAAIVERWMVPR